jgi:hypothetical protein
MLGQQHTFRFDNNCGNDHEHEVCENILDEQNDEHIQCVFFEDALTAQTKKILENGSVAGHSERKTASAGLSTTQLMTTVTIDERMGASVAAVLLSKSYCQLATPSRIADTMRRH